MIEHRVKATAEGLVGQTTASGYVIDTAVNFVALPSTHALRRVIRVSNPANNRSCEAVVLDVGPWNTDDNAYVFGDAQPQAESGKSASGEETNGSGIDLSTWVWGVLGMEDNTEVVWSFLEDLGVPQS